MLFALTRPGRCSMPTAAGIAARRRGVMRFCLPTLADGLFVVLFLRVLQLGAGALFNDPGTGWHLRTGQRILSAGAVPRADSYSFTRQGRPWVETQWLGDVIMSLTHQWGGYSLMALCTAGVLAGLFRWIYRTHVSAGGWPLIAMLVTFAAAGAASIHFLARPLLASSVGIPLCFWWASEYARGRVSVWKVWLLVPMAAVWCNLHPGVLGGVGTVGLCGVGTLLSCLWPTPDRPSREMRGRGSRLVAVALLMGAATLVNPYGVQWHVWVTQLMGSEALSRYVDEWRPLTWHDPAAVIGGLLVGVTVVATAVRRKGTDLPEALVVLFWIAQGLGSARHMPLTAMIVALQLGRILTGVRIRWRLPLFSEDMRRAESRTSGGLVSVACVMIPASLSVTVFGLPSIGLGTAGPPLDRFSPKVVSFLRSGAVSGPVFNDMSYGGTLIHELPGWPVFADDRLGLYGEDFLVDYCRAAFEPGANAARLLDRWRIRTALVGPKLPLCRWLAGQPGWTVVYRDPAAEVYTRDRNAEENSRGVY